MRTDEFAGRADGKRAVEHHDQAGDWGVGSLAVGLGFRA